MKKLTLLIAVMCFAFLSSQAQFTKGTWAIGGDISFSSDKIEDDDDSQIDFTFAPRVGYFVIDNLAIGLGLTYNSFKYGDFDSSAFGVSPLVRYYFLNNDKLYLFGHGQFGFVSSTVGDEDAETGSAWRIGPGAGYLLTESVGLEAMLTYGQSTFGDDDIKVSNILFGIGLQVYL